MEANRCCKISNGSSGGGCLAATAAKMTARVAPVGIDGRIKPRAGLHGVAKVDVLFGVSLGIDAGGLPIKDRALHRGCSRQTRDTRPRTELSILKESMMSPDST
jgi:hypothetical protein